jgi:hypothetical protein
MLLILNFLLNRKFTENLSYLIIHFEILRYVIYTLYLLIYIHNRHFI